MLVHVPAGVPSTQSRTWLHTALAADSALDRPRAWGRGVRQMGAGEGVARVLMPARSRYRAGQDVLDRTRGTGRGPEQGARQQGQAKVLGVR